MTTVEFQTLRGRLSHVLLKNELILRLLNEEAQGAVRQRGDVERRARICATFLATEAGNKETNNNLRYASARWIGEGGPQMILDLITAATKWDKYDTTDAFVQEVEVLKSEVSRVAEFFVTIEEWAKHDFEKREECANRFWQTVLRIHDFVRALDERDRDFHRFMY